MSVSVRTVDDDGNTLLRSDTFDDASLSTVLSTATSRSQEVIRQQQARILALEQKLDAAESVTPAKEKKFKFLGAELSASEAEALLVEAAIAQSSPRFIALQLGAA